MKYFEESHPQTGIAFNVTPHFRGKLSFLNVVRALQELVNRREIGEGTPNRAGHELRLVEVVLAKTTSLTQSNLFAGEDAGEIPAQNARATSGALQSNEYPSPLSVPPLEKYLSSSRHRQHHDIPRTIRLLAFGA
jgi:hypothetical protein